jgi:hypothetical protein
MFKSLTTDQYKPWQYVPNFVFSALQAVTEYEDLKGLEVI